MESTRVGFSISRSRNAAVAVLAARSRALAARIAGAAWRSAVAMACRASFRWLAELRASTRAAVRAAVAACWRCWVASVSMCIWVPPG